MTLERVPGSQPTQVPRGTPTRESTATSLPVREPQITSIQEGIQNNIRRLKDQSTAVAEALNTLDLNIRQSTESLDVGRSVRSIPSNLVRGITSPLSLTPLITVHRTGDAHLDEQVAARDNLELNGIRLQKELEDLDVQSIFADAIPQQVANGFLNTVDDLDDFIGQHRNVPGVVDISTKAFDRAIRARERRESNLRLSPEEALAQIQGPRRITTYGLTALSSTNDLLGLINTLRTPSLADGITIEDVLSGLSRASVPGDVAQKFIDDNSDFAAELRGNIDTYLARGTQWRADMANSRNRGEFASRIDEFKSGVSFADNPGLYIGLPAGWLNRNYFKPVAGIGLSAAQDVLHNVRRLPGSTDRGVIPKLNEFFGLTPSQAQEFQDNFTRHKADGVAGWQAYGLAFEDQDLNAVAKIMIEIISDPTSYIGFGLFKVFKEGTRLRILAEGIERSWTRTMDLPFRAAFKIGTFIIPKTAGQLIERKIIKLLQTPLYYLNLAHPRGLSAFTSPMTRNRENLIIARDAFLREPHLQSPGNDAVRAMMDRPWYSTAQAEVMLRELGATLEDPQAVVAFTNKVQETLTITKEIPGGSLLSLDEAVDTILTSAGVSHTNPHARIVRNLIKQERDARLQRFRTMVNQPDMRAFMEDFVEHQRFVLSANQVNPLSDYKNRMALVMGSLSSNKYTAPAFNTYTAAYNVANRVSMGFARMYLMSSLYTPFNIIENAVKTIAIGQSPRWRGNIVARTRNLYLNNEDLLPTQILFDRGSVIELQALARSGPAFTALKTERTPARLIRRWREAGNPLTKLFGIGDEAFIQTGTEIATNSQANVLNALGNKQLRENPATALEVARASEIIEDLSSPLSSFMDSNHVEQYKESALNTLITNGPDIENLSKNLTAGMQHAAEMQSLAAKYPLIPDSSKRYVIDAATEADLHRQLLDGSLDDMGRGQIFQELMSNPEIFQNRINGYLRGMLDNPPRNIDELQAHTFNLEQINDVLSQTISVQMSLNEALVREITDLDVKTRMWTEHWQQTIIPTIDAGVTASNQIIASLRQNLDIPGLTTQARNQYEDLLLAESNRIRLTAQAREDLNAVTNTLIRERDDVIRPSIIRTQGKGAANFDHPRMRDWYARFTAARAEQWEKSTAALYDSLNEAVTAAEVIDNIPLPAPRDATGTSLTMADIGGLYSSAPDAITNTLYLPDVMAMRPRKDFVARVHGRAQRIATQIDQTPEALGYSRKRIGEAYDDHMKSVRADVEGMGESAPVFTQWDEFRNDMHGYYQAADLKIRPGHVDAVDEFARGVREAVGADPVARKMLSQADVPTGQINLETSLLTADDELTRLSAVASTADDAAADAAALTAAGTRNPISEQLNDLLGLVGDARLTPEQQVARIRSAPAPDGSVWEAKRRQSLTTAIDEYNLNFPVNDNRNALNATMKFFIPFWQYESHRLFYIPRIALRNPGILHTWGLYSDNTDRGYVPIPGTGLQGNFLRNTIGMGGFSRAVNRDFPEFYDQFPGLSNTVDQAGRLGFFPNIYGSAFLASKFSNRAGVWQTGEIIPPPVGTVFEVINAIDPDNPFTDALSELFLPNRFRDYLISINVAKSMDEGQGPRASELLFKKIRGEAFTDEENAIWSTGERAASIHMIWNYQGGFTRFRPEQLDAARRLSKEIILRYVPITSEQYDEAHKLGMPIEQYYPFPRELDQELREIEAIARWRGLTSGLRPSALVEMQAKQDDFYARITEAADAKKQQELIEEERFRRTGTGHISRDELYRRKRELDSNFQQFREDLELSPEFKDVPIQYQDRIDFANEHDVQAPVRDPFSELLAFYYQVTPDDFVFFDPEVGQEVIDWNGFYTWRTGIEDSLQGQARTDFLNLVTAQDTELDAFRRADYETFIRPYKAIFQVILDQHNPQEQAIIRQFYASNRDTVSPTQRQALRDIQVGGVNLISSFQSEVSAKRRVLRRVSPELDARLAFWGETSTVTSPQAVAIHDGLFTQYDIDARTLVEIETVEPILQDLTGITE